MSKNLLQIIDHDLSHLIRSISKSQIDELKEDATKLCVQEFCEKHLKKFSDVAQTRILCLKMDTMFINTSTTVIYFKRWINKALNKD